MDFAIQLDDIKVTYRVPHKGKMTFQEYLVHLLKGQLSYSDFNALNGVNLNIRHGEHVGFLGANGAGKSTLLKVIARVLHPSQGRVRISGHIAPLLELGVGFDPELSGRENVFLNSAVLGFSRSDIERRFQRMVDFSGIEDFIDAPVRTYSSGMVTRLGFSIATDVQPDILIIDEILGVGDADFQKKSAERINSFRGGETTILMVSHQLNALNSMCERGIWIDHGRIMMDDKINKVINAYGNRMVE